MSSRSSKQVVTLQKAETVGVNRKYVSAVAKGLHRFIPSSMPAVTREPPTAPPADGMLDAPESAASQTSLPYGEHGYGAQAEPFPRNVLGALHAD